MSMGWIFLTFVAIFSRALMSVAVKTYSTSFRATQVTQAVLFTAIGGIFSLLISPLIGGISFQGVTSQSWIILIMILGQTFGNIFFLRGMASLDVGMTQIAFSSVLIWGALLSMLFLDSQFTFLQVVGMILLIASIIYVQSERGQFKISSGVLYVVLATVFFAIFQVASAELSETISPATYLLFAYFGASVLTALIYFQKLRSDFSTLRNDVCKIYPKLLFAGGLSVLFFLFSYLAFQVAPDKGLVIVLLPAQVIVSVILGIIFLRENKDAKKKVFASILAFVASILILA